MIEPIFIAQSDVPMSDEEARQWFNDRTKEAKARGCKHGRFSIHPDNPNLRLVEGWDQPSPIVFNAGGEGEQRWGSLTATPLAPAAKGAE